MARTATEPDAEPPGPLAAATDPAPAPGSARRRGRRRAGPTAATLFVRLLIAGPAEWLHLLRAQRALLTAEWARRRRKTGDLLALSGAAWSTDTSALVDAAAGTVEPGASNRHPTGGDAHSAGVPNDTAPAPDAGAARDARAVSMAARYGVFRPLCLTRSMALQSMLKRRGLDAAVRVGARRKDGRLEAHAWVELDGNILGDTPEHVAGFAPLGNFNRR